MKKQNKKQYKVVHTVSQKIWGSLALVALFVCGVMVGIGFSADRKVVADVVVESPQIGSEIRAEPEETCQIIEDLLLERLYPIESQDVSAHQGNMAVYEKLLRAGCEENSQKYRDAFNRENEIVAVLKQSEIPQATCEQIEYLLNSQLPPASGDSEYRIRRAKIYANLSERGCPENTAIYVNLAKQELEIARALEDDEFENDETIEVVETYKRMNMQAAAEEIFETAKKLTNPAIDFILEVEKIINEQ